MDPGLPTCIRYAVYMDHAHLQQTIDGDYSCGTCGLMIATAKHLETLGSVQAQTSHVEQAISLHKMEMETTQTYTSNGLPIGDVVLGMIEGFGQITAATAGYRSQLITHGFDEDTATQMTVDFHRAFITNVFSKKIGLDS